MQKQILQTELPKTPSIKSQKKSEKEDNNAEEKLKQVFIAHARAQMAYLQCLENEQESAFGAK